MKNLSTATDAAHRPAHSPRPPQMLTNSRLILGVLTTSLALIVAGGFFLIRQFNHSSLDLADLLQSPLLLPIIVISGALAIMASIAGTIILQSQSDDTTSIESTTLSPKPRATVSDTIGQDYISGRLAHIKRHVERLTDVEQTLARRMSDLDQVDPTTKKLMAEIQICTNRMLGHISDIDRWQENRDATAEESARSEESVI